MRVIGKMLLFIIKLIIFIVAVVLIVNFVVIISGGSQIEANVTDTSVSFSKDQIENLKSEDAQCILVLGAAVKPDGSPSKMLRDRLDVAISLYKKGIAPKLLLSGDNGTAYYNEVKCMLLSIAIIPLVKGEWWEKNELWVAIFWSLTFLVPFAIAYGFGEMWYQTLEMLLLDYLPFLGLLFGLFVVAGGIVLKGTIVGTPKTNLILLLIGTALASWVGTTGAAMLMIRPLIRANAWREKKAHVIVFCIFMYFSMPPAIPFVILS